jgi:hypothetical protein
MIDRPLPTPPVDADVLYRALNEVGQSNLPTSTDRPTLRARLATLLTDLAARIEPRA